MIIIITVITSLTSISPIKSENWLKKGLFKPAHRGKGVIFFGFSLVFFELFKEISTPETVQLFIYHMRID